MLFREALRELREKVGLTQEGLAKLAGTSVGNVRNYEQGLRLPSFPGVVKLAAALGVDCTAFSGCADVSQPEPEPAPKKKPAAKPRPKKGGGR